MTMAHHPVTYPLAVTFVAADGPVEGEAELEYDVGDPYAVTLRFLTGGTTIWVIGRDLLAQGLCEPVGEGDVLVSPSLDSAGCSVVVLVLRSASGQAVVQFPTRDVLWFLARTIRAVWPGSESSHVSTEALIAAVLPAE